MENKVKIFKCNKKAVIPEIKESGSAGYDLCCIEDFSISPGQRVVVGTGLVIQPPEGYHTEIVVRSSMAFKHGIMLTNNVGVIDRSYSGPEDEVKIMLFMCPEQPVTLGRRRTSVTTQVGGTSDDNVNKEINFKAGDRIAQVLFRKTESFSFEEIEHAPKDTDRGGLGSTGV
jgi:dUTP pyrophosphatase